MALDLAIIIVTWNIRQVVLDALRTLYDDLTTSGLTAQVYVVDSASSDGTAQAVRSHFPQVHVTASPVNLGFGKGNNLALQLAGFTNPNPGAQVVAPLHDSPPAVYLLNPDTLTRPGATRTLFDALMGDPKVGLVGAQLAYEDGHFQHSAFAFPGLRQLWVEYFRTPGRLIEGSFNGRYPRWLYNQDKPFTIDFPLGATWMLKREVIQQTGMFDERFFMYCEEIDWAWRIRKAGWLAQCVPTARIIHLEGQSTKQVRPRSIIDLWTSRILLFSKHYPRWKLNIARRMIASGMARKAAKESNAEIREAYLKVREMALSQ